MKLIGKIILWVMGLGVLAQVVVSVTHPSHSVAGNAVTAEHQKVATIDKSDKMQKQRKAFIEKLMEKNIFQKVEEPGTIPNVWVRPAFYALDFDTKQKFIGVVYAYYFDGSNITDSVRLIDSLSGKEVGDYSTVNPGLKLN